MKELAFLTLLAITPFVRAADDPAPAPTPAQIATTPVPRDKEPWWTQRHDHCVEITKAGGADLAFLGDSITQGWEGGGKPVWEKSYGMRKAVNFGFSGDRTEHVLWRLDNGELVGLKPKLIVVMIGTNNLGHAQAKQTPESTATGVKAIVTKLREKLPTSKILLLGIFPRDEKPDGALRVKTAQANKLIQAFADGKMITYFDIGEKFLGPDGVMSRDIMPDFLHPNTKGYQIWADAIEEKVAALMK